MSQRRVSLYHLLYLQHNLEEEAKNNTAMKYVRVREEEVEELPDKSDNKKIEEIEEANNQ